MVSIGLDMVYPCVFSDKDKAVSSELLLTGPIQDKFALSPQQRLWN